MSKQKLQQAIDAVNKRYAKGLNDDDQVSAMYKIANGLKGYTAIPEYDTYKLGTDEEFLQLLATKYGYWSEQVKNFNTTLSNKGGITYMQELNSKILASLKQETV